MSTSLPAHDGALGFVPTDGRGSLPFALLNNESLVAAASWAVEEADIELVDFTASWSEVVDRDLPLLVHDPLCPGAPGGFLAEALVQAVRTDAVVVGVRPVTDTVKEAGADGLVGATADRSELVAVASPVVLPAAVVASLEDWPDTDDLAAWVEELRRRFPVTFVEAPAVARRVADPSDLALLEAALAQPS
jgi:2-C-methyl-D-erythritol 4-phosphate cytidylyltransferase